MAVHLRSSPARLPAEVPEVPIRQTDQELVARAQAGEPWAEEAIFRRHAPGLLKLAIKLLGDRSEAEDVVQETFVLALESLPKLRDGGALGGWLKQITLSRAHRRFRRRRLLRWLGFQDTPNDGAPEQVASVERLEPRAELSWLYRCLEDLPSDERIAWTLRHLEELDLSTVAELSGCSLATTKRRLARAQAHIDRHWAGPGGAR